MSRVPQRLPSFAIRVSPLQMMSCQHIACRRIPAEVNLPPLVGQLLYWKMVAGFADVLAADKPAYGRQAREDKKVALEKDALTPTDGFLTTLCPGCFSGCG